MTAQDILCVAPTEWAGSWQRYHEMMRRLARAGNRVLVIDNLYRVSPPRPASWDQAVRMLRKGWGVLSGMRLRARSIEPGVSVLPAPVMLAGRFAGLTWPLLRGALRRLDMHRPVLWCGFPSPFVPRIAEAVNPSLIVYDCAGAFADDPSVPAAVVDAEQTLLKLADLVFTDSRGLWERHRAHHPRCYWIPTGVDFDRFAAAPPPVRRRWPAPVIGYTGTLHAWLDVTLIEAVARSRPRWTFVFVGAARIRAQLDTLFRLPNAILLGAQPHDAVPGLLAEFDVAWIPYRLAEFTRYVFPTKLLEYLAAGRPVVSTNLPEVRPFAPPVRIASTAAEMIEALESALGDDGGRGRDVARLYDWAVQMTRVHEESEAALRRGATRT